MQNEWTATAPDKNGFYWLKYKYCNNPEVVQIYDMKYGSGNVALCNGNTPKLPAFCKKHPEAMWCEVVPAPPFPSEGELS